MQEVTICVPSCSICTSPNELWAKFCGQCGTLLKSKSSPLSQPVLAPVTIARVPSFASLPASHLMPVDPKLKAEAIKIMVLLARGRLFLYMHWFLFLVISLIGFWVAHLCWTQYLGDCMSKLMMACTPLIFINLLALMFIVPICATRKEIARLKERLSYAYFKMEYQHLL